MFSLCSHLNRWDEGSQSCRFYWNKHAYLFPPKNICVGKFFFVCIAPRRCELSFRTYHFLKVSINIMCQSVKLLSFIQKLFKRDSWIANKETISSADLRGVVIYSPSMFVCVFNCFKILTPLSCK